MPKPENGKVTLHIDQWAKLEVLRGRIVQMEEHKKRHLEAYTKAADELEDLYKRLLEAVKESTS